MNKGMTHKTTTVRIVCLSMCSNQIDCTYMYMYDVICLAWWPLIVMIESPVKHNLLTLMAVVSDRESSEV